MRGGSTRDMTYAALFTALIIAGGMIRIPLPGGVPLTMQIFFVITAAAFLGPSAWMPPLLYTVLGLAGLPVFSGGGGPGYALYPTFGYILGFIPASLLIGKLYRHDAHRAKRLAVLLSGVLTAYVIGGAGLYIVKNIYLSLNVSIMNVIKYGIIAFLPYDFAKAVLALFALERLHLLTGARR